MNPDVYIFGTGAQEQGALIVRFPLPCADSTDLPPDEWRRLVERNHVVEFSPSLETQVGG